MNKTIAIVTSAVILFFAILIGDQSYSTFKRDENIASMVAKGTNPILARCSVDQQYTRSNEILCYEALKKETK